MTVATTSRRAYEELQASGKDKTQRAKILACILKIPGGMSRREIGIMTGLELGAVAGRVNELVEDGLLTEYGEVVCDITKKTVKLVKPVVAPQGEQRRLFT